jgi:hypothetical protein
MTESETETEKPKIKNLERRLDEIERYAEQLLIEAEGLSEELDELDWDGAEISEKTLGAVRHVLDAAQAVESEIEYTVRNLRS